VRERTDLREPIAEGCNVAVSPSGSRRRLTESSMVTTFQTAFAAALITLASQAVAQVTFYEGEAYRGRAFTTANAVPNFQRQGFNDRASSVVVERGRWEVCEDAHFRGRCVLLRRGSYDTLGRMGLNDRVSSVRPAEKRRRYENVAADPLPEPDYAWRRRTNERVYEVPITSVRAVVGPPNQRCWMERQQVNEPRRDPNVGGAVVGALIGGILGHQVGGGSGRDIATVGGVVGGAAIGANVGRDGGTSARDVQRCENVASGPPEYWDVTYDYRGQEHRVQMSAPPGRTILVNANGEPRQ
jgi:uncharacterized protein YcfJ